MPESIPDWRGELSRVRSRISTGWAALKHWLEDENTPVIAAFGMAQLAVIPWSLAVLFHLHALEWSPPMETIAQFARLLLVWGLLRGVVHGRIWSWAPTITTCIVYCLVLTFWTARSLGVYSDPNIYSFESPGPNTPLEVLCFRIEVTTKMLGLFVVLPWLCLGGFALALWRAWESFGLERNERYRRLVMHGIPFSGLCLIIDAPWIAGWLSRQGSESVSTAFCTVV